MSTRLWRYRDAVLTPSITTNSCSRERTAHHVSPRSRRSSLGPRAPPTLPALFRSLQVAPSRRFGSRSRANTATSDYIDRDRDDYDSRPSTLQHNPTRPVDKEKAEAELNNAIKKATNPDETAPKQKHVRSTFPLPQPPHPSQLERAGDQAQRPSAPPCELHLRERLLMSTPLARAEAIVYTWDYRSSASIWAALRVQPILSDEVQTFKGLITVHKILQEGHPIVRCPSLPLRRVALAKRRTLTASVSLPDAQGGAEPDVVARDVRANSRR